MPPEHFRETNECEQALFGACILAPSVLDEVVELASPLCFHDKDLGAAFGLLIDLKQAGKPISDPTVLAAELRKAGLLTKIGDMAFVARAANQALAHNAKWYAVRVHSLWQLREMNAALARGALSCTHSQAEPATIAEQVEAALTAAQHTDAAELETLEDMLADAIGDIAQARKHGNTLGLSTRLPILDRETGGFFNGDLTILAARPSIGKSAFALELAARIAENGKRILIVSLEMTAKQIAHRFLNRETGIPVRRMQSGELTQEQELRLEQARDTLRGWQIKAFVASNATLARIRARARVQLAQDGLDLLVVDYLGLVSHPQSRLSSYERTTAISRELKGLAIELNRPVLALAQLNREAAKAGLPSLEHLRDSGAIEQDADNVWLLHRENRDESDTKLIIAKQRQGPIGTIDLTFEADRMSFNEPVATYVEWAG